MRYLAVFSLTFLLVFLSIEKPLSSQEDSRLQINVSGASSWGNFDILNRFKALDLQIEEDLNHRPFGNGWAANAGIQYAVRPSQIILLEGGYEYFRAYRQTRFTDITGHVYGIFEFPIHRVRNIPVSFSYLLKKGIGKFDLYFGPGIGYQWTRYQESRPSYFAEWVSASKFTYTGSSLIYKASGKIAYPLTKHFSLSVPISYRYAKVGELKLDSWEGYQPEESILVDPNKNNLPVDLSGISIGFELNVH